MPLNKKKKRLTDKQFVEKEGQNCPACYSEEIYWDNIEVVGPEAQQVGSCNDCGFRFCAYYALRGYIKL